MKAGTKKEDSNETPDSRSAPPPIPSASSVATEAGTPEDAPPRSPHPSLPAVGDGGRCISFKVDRFDSLAFDIEDAPDGQDNPQPCRGVHAHIPSFSRVGVERAAVVVTARVSLDTIASWSAHVRER
jgi:hypothetical protein